jgi:hypothetical protein
LLGALKRKNMSEKKRNTKNDMGLGIALGAGLGIIFGEIVFDDVGIGIAIGAGVGIALGGAYTTVSNNKNKSEG